MSRVWMGIFLVGMTGCGESAPSITLPKTVPVTGIVTMDAKPLASATVTFVPSGTTKGTDCQGVTDEAGNFKLKQNHGQDGAPPGDYVVVVSRFVTGDGTPVVLGDSGGESGTKAAATESLPPRYSSPAETKLTAKVPEAGGEFKFDLKGK